MHDYELRGIHSTRNPKDKSGVTELEFIAGRENILAHLTRLCLSEDFLGQPLLKNHPEIIKSFAVERLVTIRFITGHNGREARPLSATFEVPCPDLEKGWYLYSINLTNGAAQFNAHPLFSSENKPRVRSFTIPDWPAVVELACRAHTRLPALPSIGWDLAITNHGPVIIEGNFNWGVNQSQLLTGKPFLQKDLLDIYENRRLISLSPGSGKQSKKNH